MAVDKTLEPFEVQAEGNPEECQIKVEIVNPDAVAVETDDGGVVVDFEGSMTEDLIGPEHNGNLAEFLEESDLDEMGSELVSDFESEIVTIQISSTNKEETIKLLGKELLPILKK